MCVGSRLVVNVAEGTPGSLRSRFTGRIQVAKQRLLHRLWRSQGEFPLRTGLSFA